MLDCPYPQKNRYCKNRDIDREMERERGKNRGRNRQVKIKQRKTVWQWRNVLNIAPRYILITIHVQAKNRIYYGRYSYTRAHVTRNSKGKWTEEGREENVERIYLEWITSDVLRQITSDFEAYALIDGSQMTNWLTGTRDCALCATMHTRVYALTKTFTAMRVYVRTRVYVISSLHK